jgi:hypothetical protein
MTDWRTRMRDAMDSDGEERLSADAARAMRRAIVAAARSSARVDVHSWKRPVAFAATVILMIGAGITAGRHLDLDLSPPEESAVDGAAAGPMEPARSNRQLQFSTPGGTRIIWVFNADLDLKATMP